MDEGRQRLEKLAESSAAGVGVNQLAQRLVKMQPTRTLALGGGGSKNLAMGGLVMAEKPEWQALPEPKESPNGRLPKMKKVEGDGQSSPTHQQTSSYSTSIRSKASRKMDHAFLNVHALSPVVKKSALPTVIASEAAKKVGGGGGNVIVDPNFHDENRDERREDSGDALITDDMLQDAAGPGAPKPREAKNIAKQSDAQNPLRVLHRLRQNADSTEFVYMLPYHIDEITPLNPYHLEIVQHSEVGSDFFTLSSFGVTHFQNGKPSFTSLEQWKRENYLFNSIIKIPIFRKFRVWKAYKLWRMAVRFGKMSIHKRTLEKNLYWLSPVFQPALLEIRRLCVSLCTKKLHNFDKKDIYTLENFVIAQEKQKAAVMAELEKFWEQATETVRKACVATLEALEQRLFGGDTGNGAPSGAAGGSKDSSGGGVSPRASSFKYTVMASKRVVHKRLFMFLQLADYIIFNTLHGMVVSSVDDLLHFLTEPAVVVKSSDGGDSGDEGEAPEELPPPPPANTAGAQQQQQVVVNSDTVFLTEVLYDDNFRDLVLAPGRPDFEGEIDMVVSSFVEAVTGPTRLLRNEQLNSFTHLHESDHDGGEDGDNSVIDMIATDQYYQGQVHTLKVTLDRALTKAENYKETFEPFRDIVHENELVDVEELRAGAEAKTITLADFQQLIIKYKQQQQDIAALPSDKDVGIMKVDTKILKNVFAPSPVACMKQLEALLPQLAAKQQRALLEEVNNGNSRLKREATSPAEYVDQISFSDQLSEKMDSLQERFDEVSAHYKLLEDYAIKIPDMDRASFTMLIPEFMGLKSQLEISQGTREEMVEKWNNELNRDISSFHDKVKELRVLAANDQILQPVDELDAVLELCSTLRDQVTELETEAGRNTSYQQTFGAVPARYVELEEVSSDINLKLGMWETVRDFTAVTKIWSQTLMHELDIPTMENQVVKWFKTAARAERELPANEVAPKLKTIVHKFKDTVPVCADLRNPALQQRHWDKIEETIGFKLERDPETWTQPFTLQVLLDMNVMIHKEEVGRISTEATQEALLEELLQKIRNQWASAEFQCMPFKEQKEVYILGGVDEIQALLDDSMVTMGTITASRFVAGIRADVEKMEHSLILFSETLDEWLAVQRNWMYLEPIFSAPDIQRQLPVEAKQFLDVDRGWKIQMKKTNEQPKALKAGTATNLKQNFEQWNETLDKIQKSLEDYLETKRMAFPRFYFLSNDELLEILAQTRNVQAVQPHMNKCFDGIKSLDFGEDPRSIDIHGMFSSEGELISLGKNCKARGNVENWLSEVEKSMVKSLRGLAKIAYVEFPLRKRHEWVMEHAAQIIIMISQHYWCTGTEGALHDENNVTQALTDWRSVTVDQLNSLCALVRGELTPLQRCKLVALITLDVHNRDIIEELLQNEVQSAHDFGWQMRLRYFWDEMIQVSGDLGDCLIRQLQAEFTYAYEYLGASMRLVITPLTDRCYMTLTGALHLKLGGAPAGPAGTGKTETTKDLAKALGRQCVVFNCGDNLDFKFMGKFFKGLAQCGAWACFDEFNRINIEVLSVVAQQIITIQIALRANLTKFVFEGSEIRLLSSFGVFITMNPGYAGRTELPDNLKALFRPMAMMIPDYALVAEVMLFSEGFESAKILSRKMTKLYKLSSEQLSQQDHYDFGMRAVKSVLVMAGSLKRANMSLSEDIVLIRAMQDSNVPKFLKDDVVLFSAIVGDLFPGVEVPTADSGAMQSAIEDQVLPEAGLQRTDDFVLKVIQLHETFTIRFGVMTVGPTGGGKTAVAMCLARACTLLRQQGSSDNHIQVTHTYILNPKSISMGELYGNFNLLTNEWTDGLGSTIIRNANNDTSPDRKWIVFDGPVDAIWIENMNTVLDDNRTLCLPNGERIKLNGVTMRMLFEVEDLRVASPATVSRCGMVWVPSEAVGWQPFVRTWANSLTFLPETLRDTLVENLFYKYAQLSLNFVRRECKEEIASNDLNLIVSTCSIFEALVRPERGVDLSLSESELGDHIKKLFLFSLVWGVGGNVDTASKELFSENIRDEISPDIVRFPNSGQVYDYFVEPKERKFRPWTDIVGSFVYNKDLSFFDILVPTMDTVRYSYVLEALLEIEKPILFNGASGNGKSVIIQDCLARILVPKSLISFNINFSAQTTSVATQEMIESRLEKKRKGVYGAPSGKKLVLFVDDVNMPQREVYGAQPPVELLRQVLDRVHHFRPRGGFYERKKLFWEEIVDTTMVAACGPPGGGRNPVTPRFFRHFNMLNISAPSQQVMGVIFSSILGGFLEDFVPDVKVLVKSAVTASIEVYSRISEEMLPTPSKSHYTFNLRDLAKVVQGMLTVRPNVVTEARTFCMLWVHECQRVFQDRLINEEDKVWFNRLAHELMKRYFSIDGTFEDLFGGVPIIFGDYMRPGMAREERIYEAVTDMGKLGRTFETYLDDYNGASSSKSMNLVFFSDAMQHISRLCRILRQPRGNAMLVGLGGSGKQSITRIASFISDYKCVQIELTRGYGNSEFREDLKKLMVLAGVERKATTFLFTDSQIVKESFLEDINGILNSGEVPNLFANDEKDKIVNDCREAAAKMGKPQTKDAIWAHFINTVRENLHLVLCMSPVGDAFRRRCRMFPSLINCCTIDWFLPWPDAALMQVSSRYLQSMEGMEQPMKDALSSMCVVIHQSVGAHAENFFAELRRRFYTTPKSYLDLIDLYCSSLGTKRTQLNSQRERFINGLNKMTETNAVIDTMKKELSDLQPILAQKTIATKELLVKVAKDQDEAAKVREVVSAETALVKQQTAEVLIIQEDAQRDLDQALPALNAAVQALNSLTKADLTEVKSFSKPPQLVSTTLEAVMTLLGEKADWDTAKKQMSDANFLNRLFTFDKDNIPAKALKGLQKYVSMSDYNSDSVGKVSRAAKGMCMWTLAMDVYARIAKDVEPKRMRLAEANATLQGAQDKLKVKQDQLTEVETAVENLQRQLKEAQDEQTRLSEQAELCENRLIRAGTLTSALGDEAVRWGETAEILIGQLNRLVGDVFLACSCVSYYGAFTGSYRDRLVSEWIENCKSLEIPVSDDFTLRGTLANPVDVRDWNIWALPSDSVSIDNGVLVTSSKRWPLMIDPQMQANRWIKNMEEKNGLRLIKLTDQNFMRTVENSIRIGNPVLLEDVGEELDPSLEPILLKQLFKQGGRVLIRLGDSDVDYDPRFKFYITTKRPNPHYMPEVCIKTTIINFTVTMKGLEDQLLGDVVRKERPDLEAQKDRLVVSMANDKKQLKELEDRVLKLLKESEGNILDNRSLISTLEQSKITSKMISERVKEAEETEKAINVAREGYRVAATRGSILYFVVADLGFMDPMYQYSLTYFQSLFNTCIDQSEKKDDLTERLESLMTYTTEFIFSTVCRGLFEKHKLIFSFLIATSIMRNTGAITFDEWNFLLRGGDAGGRMNPAAEFISESTWGACLAVEQQLPGLFNGLTEHICENVMEWRSWIHHERPHEIPIPGSWGSSLTPFQKLLLLRIFRPEKNMFAMADYIKEEMGVKYTESPPFTLAEVFKDTACTTPIIFVLSTGADPTSSLLRFAEEMQYQERLHVISLGQGQGPIAEKLITTASKKGDWVCLMNCHLATSWMGQLEKIIENFSGVGSDILPEFRLWLTSMPASTFPVAVLQNGIKLTNEPPRGVRANVLRSMADLGDEKYESCTKPRLWKKLLFGLSFFHAIIQERRKYGPLGWNIRYEFNTSDIECAQMVLKMFIEDHEDLPWEALVYVTGQINYGGRVTDDIDRRCLMTILDIYYSDKIVSDDKYKFSPSGRYYAPEEGTLESVLEYVRTMPMNDDPEVFGLHDNANIAYQLQETQRLLGTVLEIQPRLTSGAGARSPEDIVAEFAATMQAEVPALLNLEECAPGMFELSETGVFNSLDIVLQQESDRFNRLLGVLGSSLAELQKALKGLVVMSAELEAMYTSILNNQVPEMWTKVGYPSLKPLSSWTKDLVLRVTFMREWLRMGTPKCFWLPGFFFPQGFMTGVLQNHARRYAIPIDTLNFGFKVQQYDSNVDVKAPPKDGVYIDGLFLEAARWDKRKNRLIASQPGKMFAPMPVIYLIPTANFTPPKDDYECPLYKTNVRAGILSTTGQSTNFVLNIYLPTEKKPEFWVLQGTAMVTMTND